VNNPIELFCRMVQHLPAPGRDQFIRLVCDTLGWGRDHSVEDENPLAFYTQPSLEDLRKRLNYLTGVIGLGEEFLIDGATAFAIRSLKGMSRAEYGSDTIDRDLKMLKDMEEWQKKSVEERPAGFTDEFLQTAIRQAKSVIAQRPAQREGAAEVLVVLEQQFPATFTQQYWLDWLRERAVQES
jgi:hypothetical protein